MFLIITLSLNWLNLFYSFEKRVVIHKDLQGGLNKSPSALTAYVLIAILQDPSAKTTYADEIKNATDYLVDRLNSDANVYEVSLISYALTLADHEKKEESFEKLMSLAKTSGGQVRCPC